MQFFSSIRPTHPRILLSALIGLSAALSPLAYGQTATTIPAIQGKGEASAMVGQTVTIQGVVTGDFQDKDQLSGFTIQDPKGDGDTTTSDGIFIYVNAKSKANGIDVKVGDQISVTGTVAEFNGQTQISQVTDLKVLGQGAAIAPTAVTLPLPAGTTFESYEGMLITFPQQLTVSNNYQLDRFGTIGLSLGRLFVPTNLKPVAEVVDDAASRSFIADDGSDAANPAVTPYLDANGSRRTGSSVTGVTGVMAYSHDAYRLEPTAPLTFEETNPRPAAPGAVGGTLKVGAANVLNYWTSTKDVDPKSRGAADAAEFARQSAKVVTELKGLDADVLGLMEVQNNGETAIGDIVTKLNAAYGQETYAYIKDDPNAITPDMIKVALIYKIAAVTPKGGPVVKEDDVFERYPLAQTFVSKANGATFTIVVNHFKSKSRPNGTDDVDTGEGAFNKKRVLQANSLLAFVNSLKQSTGDPDVLVVGDLNSYVEESPVLALKNGGLQHLNLLIPEADRFSFVYSGRSGSLDHALATPELAKQVTGFTEWHINADEPDFMEYGKLKPEGFVANPYRASDHDPLLIGLNLTP